MYEILDLLPPNVRSALPEKGDQEKWMKAFNKAFKESKNVKKATKDAWEILKSSPNCRHFEGWMSTAHVDIQGDKMEQNALLKRLEKHIERGGTLVDVHSNRILGSLYDVELKKYDDGIDGIYGHGVIFQGEPYFDKMWQEVHNGIKKGFSIGGFAVKTKEECNGHYCHRNVLDSSIHEVSLCSNPADPYARMTDFNSLAKSEDKVTIPKKHLTEDQDKFKRMKQLLDQLMSDDEEVTGTGESKEPSGAKFQNAELESCGCGKLEKVGTRVGICRGHMQSGHKMTNICQGVGFDSSSDRASLDPGEEGVIIDWIPDQVAHYEHQIYVDEQKKAKEQMDINLAAIQENNEIRAFNNRAAERYVSYFQQALDKMDVDDKVKKAFQQALDVLDTPSGLPVSARLDMIDMMGCPKCKSIAENIRRAEEAEQSQQAQAQQQQMQQMGGVMNNEQTGSF